MHIYDFISIIIVVTSVIGLAEILKNKRRTSSLNYLTGYFLVAIIMFTIGHYKLLSIYIQNNSILKRKIFELINCCFSLFELLFFSSFIETQNNKPQKHFLRSAPYIFITLLITASLYVSIKKMPETTITNISVQLNILEYTFLLLLCLRLFYFTLQNPINAPIIDKSVLLIVGSLFLYISVSLPNLIISEKVNTSYKNIYNTIYDIHYIVLLIVFISITITLKKKKLIFYA